MSAQHPSVDVPGLGVLTRAESTFDDGTVAVHDWFAGTVTDGDHEVELMVDGTDPEAIEPLLPRLRAVVADLHRISRIATDAIITRFSDVEPEPHELDAGAADLRLEAIEATEADHIVLHFADICGEHFPDGYWPAAHLDAEGRVAEVTVES